MADEADITRLLIADQPRLRARVRAAVGDPHLTEDIVQEVAIIVLRSRDRFVPGSNFTAWINEIQRRVTWAECRRRQRRGPLMDGDLLDQFERELRDPSAWEREREALGNCLERLPDDGRHALLLRYGEDLDGVTLAERLGRSVDGVKGLLKRMRIALGDCIERRLSMEDP